MLYLDAEIFIWIGIFVLILFSLWYIIRTPSIKTTVSFPEREYVIQMYKNTPYYNSLNQFDLKTRACLTKDQLLYKVSMSLVEPDDKQKDRIISVCKEADQLLIKNGMSEIAKYDWNIVLFSGIENNYPHTHDNVIFLPIDMYSLKTFIHEKIHVYQRKNPNIMYNEVRNINFKMLTKEQEEKWVPRDIYERMRHNPDFDRLSIWKNRYIPLSLFTTQSRNIADTSLMLYDRVKKRLINVDSVSEYLKAFHLSPQKEHPYEILACIYSEKCVR